MIKILILTLLFSCSITAQVDILEQSFLDEIDLLFGIDVGMINSINSNGVVKNRKQDGISLQTSNTFGLQPIISIKA